jgi:Domain of unknown function DUF11
MRLTRILVTCVAILVIALIPAVATAGSTADLSVAITGPPNPAFAEWNITWTITVRNLGPGEATGVRLNVHHGSDSEPVSVISTQGTCRSPFGGEIDFTLGNIASGGTVTVTVVMQNFTVGTNDDFSAVVSSTSRDPVAKNNSAAGHVRVIEGPPPPSQPPGPFCAPRGGVSTGGGGTAGSSSAAGPATIALLALAGLIAVAVRFARR